MPSRSIGMARRPRSAATPIFSSFESDQFSEERMRGTATTQTGCPPNLAPLS